MPAEDRVTPLVHTVHEVTTWAIPPTHVTVVVHSTVVGMVIITGGTTVVTNVVTAVASADTVGQARTTSTAIVGASSRLTVSTSVVGVARALTVASVTGTTSVTVVRTAMVLAGCTVVAATTGAHTGGGVTGTLTVSITRVAAIMGDPVGTVATRALLVLADGTVVTAGALTHTRGSVALTIAGTVALVSLVWAMLELTCTLTSTEVGKSAGTGTSLVIACTTVVTHTTLVVTEEANTTWALLQLTRLTVELGLAATVRILTHHTLPDALTLSGSSAISFTLGQIRVLQNTQQRTELIHVSQLATTTGLLTTVDVRDIDATLGFSGLVLGLDITLITGNGDGVLGVFNRLDEADLVVVLSLLLVDFFEDGLGQIIELGRVLLEEFQHISGFLLHLRSDTGQKVPQ